LVSIGSTTAFNDAVSLTLASLYASYLVACSLLLWRRCTGSIKVAKSEDNTSTNLPGNGGNLIWGPWRIPGIWGIAVNIFACVYLIVILIFCFWPSTVVVTPATMNYTSLVMGSVAILSAVYYLFWAHRTYKGPIIEIDFTG